MKQINTAIKAMTHTLGKTLKAERAPRLKSLKKWLARTPCVFCAAPTTSYGCCEGCNADMPRISHFCRLCALPLNTPHADVCARCRKSKTPLDGAWSAFHYDFPLRKALHLFKFSRHFYFGNVLGNLWLERLQEQDFTPDILIPVPLHIKRLRQRGFNPAYELTKPLAKHFNLPLRDNLCRRIKNTRPQLSCPPQERSLNVRNAFSINEKANVDFAGKVFLITDDVITTGSTTYELASVLKKAGARQVFAWSLLRS